MPASPQWQLVGFLERLDTWIADEDPVDELRLEVTAWILSRFENPYDGVRREPGFANLWFGRIPRSQHQRQVVVSSYWIEETTHTVRCDSIATLALPL